MQHLYLQSTCTHFFRIMNHFRLCWERCDITRTKKLLTSIVHKADDRCEHMRNVFSGIVLENNRLHYIYKERFQRASQSLKGLIFYIVLIFHKLHFWHLGGLGPKRVINYTSNLSLSLKIGCFGVFNAYTGMIYIYISAVACGLRKWIM